MESTRQGDCEHVVVGSGAGGGTVAARLAEASRRVVLPEAGGDAKAMAGATRLLDDYDVPVFHAFASENEAMAWNFFVRHYGDDAQQQRDPKYCETLNGRRVDGVLYPRAGTLGGCTAHNAMIMVYPHNSDWDSIARDTGDASWSSARAARRGRLGLSADSRLLHRERRLYDRREGRRRDRQRCRALHAGMTATPSYRACVGQ